MIFTAAADDDVESIVEKSFENVEQGNRLSIKLLNLYHSLCIFSFYCLDRSFCNH